MAGIPDFFPLAFGDSFDRRPLEEDFAALDLAPPLQRPELAALSTLGPREERDTFGAIHT